MIDSHIHADSRSSEDFEKMFVGGIDTAISCCYYPYKISSESVLVNHMLRILNFETKRCKSYGIDLKVALGIHPTNSLKSNNEIFKLLQQLIDGKKIVAIGEIGLEELTNDEIINFKNQLELADETKTKVIIHTPRKNKLKVLKEIKSIVLESIDPKLVIIDHINQEVIGEVIDEKFMIGLTVQPQKMDVEEAISILTKYGFDDFLLNSDISTKPSDPLSVPKTIRTMEKMGLSEKNITKVAFANAKKYFKI